MGKLLAVIAAALGLAGGAALAQTDTSITITTSHVACQVPPPADVPPPATPSAAAGNAAVKNHNYALARANFQMLADKGDAEGERLYGILLLQDCTGIQDKEEAVKWLAKATDAGDVQAERQLGVAYMNGNGVAQDDTKAFALLTKAAETGNPAAEMSLGYLYLSGRGTAQDAYQGTVWSVKAAEQAVPQALFNIAVSYHKGAALPQDDDKAAYYMEVALLRSTLVERARNAGVINDISRTMSADDLKRSADRARRWSPGPRSLSDVLDDAGRMRARTARN